MVKRSRDQSHDAPRPLQLIDDGRAAFGFPRPDAADELLAAELAAVRLLALHELALDNHLRGDAGVVRSRLPQHVAAAHALEADEHILQCVVQRVAHVERAGDVRRRNDDRVRLGPGTVGAPAFEGVGLVPFGMRCAARSRRADTSFRAWRADGFRIEDLRSVAASVRARKRKSAELLGVRHRESGTGVLRRPLGAVKCHRSRIWKSWP